MYISNNCSLTPINFYRLGRMVKRTDHDGTFTHWVYNDDLINNDTPSTMGIGKLDSVYMVDSTGFELYRQNYTYTQELGLAHTTETIIEEGTAASSQQASYTTEADYDRFHRPETVAYPNTSGDILNQEHLQLKYVYRNGVVEEVQNLNQPGLSYWKLNQMNAAGQVTMSRLGNGIQPVKGYDEAGRLTLLSYGTDLTSGYDATYEYDSIGNLVSRDTTRNDSLQTLSEQYYYDALNRLTSVTINGTADAQTFGYDALGNIRAKTGITSYTYDSVRPHAVSAINGSIYDYDANGAIRSGSGRTVQWTTFNKPSSIYNAEARSNFFYGPDRARYKHESIDLANGNQKDITYYVGASFEKIIRADGTISYKHYIRAGGKTIAEYTVTGTVKKTEYLLRDNQGSTIAVTDVNGVIKAQLDYDAFGRRRPILGETLVASIISDIPRGYTGHEHLDKLGLIHMNGRVFMPEAARFLSADPFVQAPNNMQSYNRYAYVFNNPMSYTDPSGFFSLSDLRDAQLTALGTFISVSLHVNLQTGWAYTKPVRRSMREHEWLRIAGSAGASMGGTLVSAMYAAYVVDISGGSYRDIGKAAVISYAQSMILSEFVHDMDTTTDFWSVDNFKKILAHGAVGGAAAYANGGKFADGFWSAALSQAFALAGGYEAMGVTDKPTKTIHYVQNAAAAAIVGGTISRATGGSFATGAIAALYGRMFNELAILVEETGDNLSQSEFGAKLTLMEDGEILDEGIRASTWPDDPNRSALKQGLYKFTIEDMASGKHLKIPFIHENELGGIFLHKAFSPSDRGSRGCITVHPDDWSRVYKYFNYGESGRLAIYRTNVWE